MPSTTRDSRRIAPQRIAFLLLLLLLLAPTSALLAQPPALHVTKLTPPGQAWSDLMTEPAKPLGTSPDGKWVAFWFDADTDDVPSAYVASRFGGDVRRISTVRPTGAYPVDLVRLAFTLDSRRVLMLIDQETLLRNELWSVPVEGGPGAAVKTSGSLAPGFEVRGFELSADGLRAVYTVSNNTVDQLWSVPVAGGVPPVRLDPATGSSTEISRFQLVGADVVFLYDADTVQQLWRAPIDGSGAAVRLNGDLVPAGDVTKFAPTPDGSRVLYLADQRFDEVVELWSVPITGPASAAVRLSPTLPAFGDVQSTGRPSSDGTRVLFTVDSAIDEQFELWSTPIDGPPAAAVHLNVPPVAGGDVVDYSSLGDRAVYLIDNAIDNQEQAYIVPIAGPFTASVRLHGNLAPNQEVAGAAILPASPENQVLLVSNLRDAGKLDLFLQHLDGVGTPHALFGDPPAGIGFRSACGAGAAPDSSWLVVCADLDTADKVELYRVDLDFSASTPDRLSSSFASATSDVTRVISSPDGVWAAYRSDPSTDEEYWLLRVPTDGSATAQRVHAQPLSAAHDVDPTLFAFTPDSFGILYAADHETDGKLDLWISDAMVFRADFEAGNLLEWSSTTP